ncbi:aspartate--tRNA(Asn) ligase [Geosporobacter ferrireducens]|uniref:Aspartate--tRNA ligase n=1 Tax=Geosporobacter ferrireducens TaxID=1424294 RepID=A0A1D8GPP9_9FIRM|nr:aspartate--tRNA(Asn) ligase [Geosporobacter ferrireducens]AOT72916.1 aspartate--tRNA(Asn) ligase [Geosporobacter ferrireducens]MTI55322.1 aspartate--tRNA(Asn) ligase [Geosporobacter ferrireducens]
MERTYVKDLSGQIGNPVLLRGWVHKIRDFGKLKFIMLRDKTGLVQLVISDQTHEGLRIETPLEVRGILQKNDKAVKGLEVQVEALSILAEPEYDILPIEINREDLNSALETNLNYRSLSLRNVKKRAIFKVQEEITECFRTFLKGEMFSEIHTPKLVSSGTEGGSEVFTVKYFDRRAFLAQSPQFYKQMMVGAGFERVFEVGHAYRAELHNTWRHLNEYVSLDVEMGFIKDEFDLMNLENRFMKYLFDHLKETCAEELEMYHITLEDIGEIPKMTLEEVHEILLDRYDKKSPVGNIDAEGEILISQYVKEKYNSDFVFLTKYPVKKRPVYAMPDDENPELTKSFDLIYKGLEITTGGQRIHSYSHLKNNMIKFGLNPDDFDFYVDTFKYGMPPHGGFAIGLERLTMKILELDNIREATLFPRDMKRLTP